MVKFMQERNTLIHSKWQRHQAISKHSESQHQIVQEAFKKYKQSQVFADESTHTEKQPQDWISNSLKWILRGSASEVDDLTAEECEALMGNPYIPTLTAMAMFGLIGVRLKRPRIPMIHPLKSTFVYSFTVFVLIVFGSWRIITTKLPIVMNPDLSLDQRMISLEILVHVFPMVFIPSLWMETTRSVRKPIQAAKYEVLYKAITKKTVTWQGLYWYNKNFTIFLIVATPVVYYVSSHVLPELALPVWEGYVLMLGWLLQIFLIIGMLVRSIILSGLADRLLNHFRRVAFPHFHSIDDLRSVRRLWCSLGDLYDSDDTVLTTCVVTFVFAFAMFVVALYEMFSFFLVEQFMLGGGQFAVAGMYIAEIYCLCINSHIATEKMHHPFVQMLDSISAEDSRPEFIQEISLFYAAINAKAPRLTLGEYANIDKGVLGSLLSSVVTYLIVLVQFRQSTG